MSQMEHILQLSRSMLNKENIKTFVLLQNFTSIPKMIKSW